MKALLKKLTTPSDQPSLTGAPSESTDGLEDVRLKLEIIRVFKECLQALNIPTMQSVMAIGFLSKQQPAEIREMAQGLIDIADRLRPLLAETQTVRIVK